MFILLQNETKPNFEYLQTWRTQVPMTMGIKSIFTKEYAKVLEVLIRARKKQGLTQHAVASALGKPQSFVSKYESGERRIDLVEFFCIVKALGEDPLTLLTEMEFLEQAPSPSLGK